MKIISLFVLIALLTFRSSPAAGQDSDDKLDAVVEPGLGGWYRSACWMPVHIFAQNKREAYSLSASAKVEDTYGETTYVRSIEMPTGSRKSFFLYVKPLWGLSNVDVTLTASGGVTGRKIDTAPLQYLEPEDALIVVAGHRSIGMPLGKGKQEQNLVVVYLKHTSLPASSNGYDAANMVVLIDPKGSDFDDPARIDAIIQWVFGGGHAVIALGQDWQAVTSSPFSNLLPATPTGVVIAQWPGTIWLEKEGADRTKETSYSVCLLDKVAGRIHASDREGRPLVVSRRYGFGLVTLLAFSPESAAFQEWWSREGFWKKLVALGESPVRTEFGDLESMLSAEIRVDPGSFWPFAVVFFIYLLLIGIVDYWLMRKLRRPIYTWLTSTVWAVLCLAVVIGIIWYRGEAQSKSKTLTIVDAAQESPYVRCRTFSGLLSANRAMHTFEVHGLDPLIAPWSAPQRHEYYGYPSSRYRSSSSSIASPSYLVEQSPTASSLETVMYRNSLRMLESECRLPAEEYAGISVRISPDARNVIIQNGTDCKIAGAMVATGEGDVSWFMPSIQSHGASESEITQHRGGPGNIRGAFYTVLSQTGSGMDASGLAGIVSARLALGVGDVLLLAVLEAPPAACTSSFKAYEAKDVVILRKLFRAGE